MISAKKLIKLARKWQKLAAIRRRRITTPQKIERVDSNSCSTSSAVEKGNFVVYSADQQPFLLPLEYLNIEIVRALLKLAEEEFGSSHNGPLTLPCDAALVEYVIALIKRHVTRDVKALLMSISSRCCSLSSDHYPQVTGYKEPIYGF